MWVLTDNGTQFKGAKFVRCSTYFGTNHQASLAAHPQTNGQVECVNRLILQVMKMRMFHDLEAKGRNWHKELPSVLWALRTNVNQARKDTPFHLVYGADAVLPPKIFLELAWVAQFNKANQDEAREFDSNLLEEKHKQTLNNV
jgi:transposase InsO family protein